MARWGPPPTPAGQEQRGAPTPPINFYLFLILFLRARGGGPPIIPQNYKKIEESFLGKGR